MLGSCGDLLAKLISEKERKQSNHFAVQLKWLGFWTLATSATLTFFTFQWDDRSCERRTMLYDCEILTLRIYLTQE